MPFPGAGLPHRLEGSRFAGGQFYQMAAGGSREQAQRLEFNRADRSKEGIAVGRMPRETFPGAACCQVTELPTDKAAPLQAVGGSSNLGRGRLRLPHPSLSHSCVPSRLTVGPANTE